MYPPAERRYFRKCNSDAILSFDRNRETLSGMYTGPPHSTPVDVDPHGDGQTDRQCSHLTSIHMVTDRQTDSALISLQRFAERMIQHS